MTELIRKITAEIDRLASRDRISIAHFEPFARDLGRAVADRAHAELMAGDDFDLTVERAEAAVREPFNLILADIPIAPARRARERLHRIAADAWRERIEKLCRPESAA